MFSSFKQGRRRTGGRSSKWHQLLRTKWFKNPHCHWCNVITVIDGERGSVNQNPLAATLDHIYSNLDLRRLIDGGKTVVVSCERCNGKRSHAEVTKVYPNIYDKRHNKVSIIEILQTGKVPTPKLTISRKNNVYYLWMPK